VGLLDGQRNGRPGPAPWFGRKEHRQHLSYIEGGLKAGVRQGTTGDWVYQDKEGFDENLAWRLYRDENGAQGPSLKVPVWRTQEAG